MGYDAASESDREWLADARDGVIGCLEAAGVIGTMPNIVANRLNRQLDLGGPSCAVSSEERSGLDALELAVRALRKRELDAALVGAVDLSCEPVHVAAAQKCLRSPDAEPVVPGDAAVALVLKRLDDASRDGDRIYAVIASDTPGGKFPESEATLLWGPGSEIGSLTDRFGHAHAASGLFHLVAAGLSIHHRRLPTGKPWLSKQPRSARIITTVMNGTTNETTSKASDEPNATSSWHLIEHPQSPPRFEGKVPRLYVFEGRDSDAVLRALDERRTATPWDEATSPAVARLVVVADDDAILTQRIERARAHIQDAAPAGEGVHFRVEPVRGDLAFVFTSAGSAYHGMGRELLAALPELSDRLARRFDGLEAAMGWVFDDPALAPSNDQRLWGASCLSQIHAELTRGLLGLQPDAAIGYSSGESNSLFALGAWTDMDAMRREIDSSGLYERELAGSFDAVARAWAGAEEPSDRGAKPTQVHWAVWGLLAPITRVREWIAAEPRVHLAIIHTESDCVIAGDAAGCRRVAGAVRRELGGGRCHELDYNMAAHVPEVDAFRKTWLDIHRRTVSPVPGVRFYSGGSDAPYIPDSEACTQTILNQAHRTLDFSKLIERAWAANGQGHGPLRLAPGRPHRRHHAVPEIWPLSGQALPAERLVRPAHLR